MNAVPTKTETSKFFSCLYYCTLWLQWAPVFWCAVCHCKAHLSLGDEVSDHRSIFWALTSTLPRTITTLHSIPPWHSRSQAGQWHPQRHTSFVLWQVSNWKLYELRWSLKLNMCSSCQKKKSLHARIQGSTGKRLHLYQSIDLVTPGSSSRTRWKINSSKKVNDVRGMPWNSKSSRDAGSIAGAPHFHSQFQSA